jgi:hypothetical protein
LTGEYIKIKDMKTRLVFEKFENFVESLNEKIKIKIKKGKTRSLGFTLKTGGSQIIDPQEWQQEIKTPEDEWDSYLEENESVMVKRMGDESKKNWEELKSDLEHKGYAVFALEEYLKSDPTYKWKYVFCNSEEGVRNQFKSIPKLKNEKEIPDNFNAIDLPIEFPINGPSSTFFKDDEWEITEDFKNRLLEEVISPLKEIQKDMVFNPIDKNEPKFFLRKMDIQTSCSRFRNSEDAKDLTFSQLSEKRNNAAKSFILSELEKLGILIDKDTEITQDWKGKNGDGSSGPNPPKSFIMTKSGKESDIVKDESYRDHFGKTIENKKGYDTFKYCIAGLEIVMNKNWEPIYPEPKEKQDQDFDVVVIPIPSKNYGISFYSEPKYLGFDFWLPKIEITGKRHRRGKWGGKGKNWGKTNCPKW